ncbi:MAG: enoyl-CoA hydratase-related protein, partial [Robiginitomaculum sp.]|nr:enoyl-CoA hydratase-related protein [Robiginitomaculum sp.]
MSDYIKIEKTDHIMTIGLNRPAKKNALTRAMLRGLTKAYTDLCDDPDLRCGILYSTSDIFTAGLDMMDVAPALMNPNDDGMEPTADDEVDPFGWAGLDGKVGRLRNTPMITAVNGRCFTAGIELALGTDIIIADADATFTQAEIRRGLMPLGGATARYVNRFGWGNAMRWLLTG